MKSRIYTRSRLRPGQKIMTSGYQGTVVRLYSDGPTEGARIYEVRLPGGLAAVSGSDLVPVAGRRDEIGRRGRLSRDPRLKGLPGVMYRMAVNAEGAEVHVAWPREKRAVASLEKAGLVKVRRTRDRIGDFTEWWYRLA